MRKKGLDEVEVKRLLEEGWRFRVKRMKGYEYITAKKGRSERSFGAYDEERWNRLQELIKEHEVESRRRIAKREREIQKREKEQNLREMLLSNRSLRVSITCQHAPDMYCRFWKYDRVQDFFPLLDELISHTKPYKKIEYKEGEERWVVRASSLYCAHCPAYESRLFK